MISDTVAVVWLRKEDWPRWLELGSHFQCDYDRWLKQTEAAIEKVEEVDCIAERVLVDSDKFVEWCRATRVNVDRISRAMYAAFVLSERSGATLQ